MASPRLIYVMGPSGAGKTRVIDYARRRIDGSLPILFAHRYITRPRGLDTENYIELSRAEFALREARGLFACHWDAYGFSYGVGVEIKSWLKARLVVVIDGSRAHFVTQPLDLGPITPVLVTAGHDQLRSRLTAREREDLHAIEARLERADKFAPADLALIAIDNSGPIETAGDAFVAILEDHARAL